MSAFADSAAAEAGGGCGDCRGLSSSTAGDCALAVALGSVL
jgi:hypothetical protein